MQEYLFSYGTLQPNLAPPEIAPLVRSLISVGRAYIQALLYDFGGYPGVVLVKTQQRVWGEVLALPDDPDMLRCLDEFEEFYPSNPKNSQFVREKSLTVLENGGAFEAWVYVYNRDPGSAPLIENGDFAKARKLEK